MGILTFKDAFDKISGLEESLAPDTMLKLYAYYKKATNDYNRPSSSKAIINAFKTNAWIQVSHLSIDEAKENYIAIINSLMNP